VGASYAQDFSDGAVIPLTVDEGYPLQVTLTQKLRFKANETVHAKTVEAVYAFDREVVPSGTEVIGTITGFQKPRKWKRISSMLGGDFTPLREPQISFHTLVLSDGSRIPIKTIVVSGAEKIVQSEADKRQGDKSLKNSLTSTDKEFGSQRLKDLLWGLAPFHPQSLPTGAHLQAVLQTPLDFGDAVFVERELDEIGSQLPAGAVASVRLITPIDSGITAPGESIEALLTRPVFSADHKLVFPAGSTLRGKVLTAKPAKNRHRNGQMAFVFSTIEPPASLALNLSPAQPVEGSLTSVHVGHAMKALHIDENGATRIVES